MEIELDDENNFDKCCDMCEKNKIILLTIVCIFLIVLYVFLLTYKFSNT